MKFKDLIFMAFRNLKTRKMRTFLTVLGVVIGATAVLVMISVGIGYRKSMVDAFASMGSLTTLELKTSYYDEKSQMENKTQKKLNDAAINEVSKVKHILKVMPIYQGIASLKSGKYVNDYIDVKAMPPELMEEFSYKLGEGRFLENSDLGGGVVLGSEVAKGFYDPKRPNMRGNLSDKVKPMDSKIQITSLSKMDENGMGQTFDTSSEDSSKTYTERIKVVGTLEDNPDDWENSRTIFMTINYMKKLMRNFDQVSGTKTAFGNYSTIMIKVDSMENIKEVQESLKAMGYYAVNYLAEYVNEMNKQLAMTQAILGAIGAVSFLVASIGITNTMIMAIYERTKEIGVMKVIGASIKDIEKLFLVEAGFIGFFGGVLGTIISFIISVILNIFGKEFLLSRMPVQAMEAPKLSIIPAWLVILALLTSTLIGIISGFIPARRAMKLPAIEAIKNE